MDSPPCAVASAAPGTGCLLLATLAFARRRVRGSGVGRPSRLSTEPGTTRSSRPGRGFRRPGELRHLGGAMERQEDDMPTRRQLKGRTIAALAADGYESVELIIP